MPKYLINLDKPVMDVSDEADATDGLKATQEKLSRALATMLKTSTEGDALKYLSWAIDLYRTGKIEVDESDMETLTTFVRTHRQSWVLVRGQLLQAIAAAKQAPLIPAAG